MEHNSGEGKFTAKCLPWVLIWSKSTETRGEAMKLENKIKKRGAKRFLQNNFNSTEASSGQPDSN